MQQVATTPVLQSVPLLLNFPEQRFTVDYDAEADILYISFRRPQKATNSELGDDGIIYRYHDKTLVGLTILDASTHQRAVA